MPAFKKLIIKEIKRETKDAVSIVFNIPTELQPNYEFVAGQYLNIRLTLDGEEIRRAYSICSSPESGELRIAVKAVKNGKFSQFANTKLKAGDILEVGKPEGKFTFEPQADRQKNYAAFVAGSGITPIISIAKSVLNDEPDSDVTLFYGNKGFASIIFREEIEGLKNKFMNRLRVVHILSRESLGNSIQKGRIDSDKLQKLHKAFLENTTIDEVFVCGPEEMIHSVKENFAPYVSDAKNIHFELFTTSGSKKDKVESSEKSPSIASNVKVIIDGDTLELAMESKGETILDAAFKAG